jgi:hypothetical protein
MNVSIRLLNSLEWDGLLRAYGSGCARYASKDGVAYRHVPELDAAGKAVGVGELSSAPLPKDGPLDVADSDWEPVTVNVRYYPVLTPIWWKYDEEKLPKNAPTRRMAYCMFSPDLALHQVYVAVIDVHFDWSSPPSRDDWDQAEKVCRPVGLGWFEWTSRIVGMDGLPLLPADDVGQPVEVPIGTDFGFAEAMDALNGQAPFGARRPPLG